MALMLNVTSVCIALKICIVQGEDDLLKLVNTKLGQLGNRGDLLLPVVRFNTKTVIFQCFSFGIEDMFLTALLNEICQTAYFSGIIKYNIVLS